MKKKQFLPFSSKYSTMSQANKQKDHMIGIREADPEVNNNLKERFQNLWKDYDRAKVVPADRSIYDVLFEINPALVNVAKKRPSGFKKLVITKSPFGKNVPLGYIQIGTAYGNPKVYSEGYYYRSGVGSKFGQSFRMNDQILQSKDKILTIINLKENEVAIVVNETITQVCCGPAKYIFIEPWCLAGPVVDLMSLNRSKCEFTHNGSIRALAFHVPKGEVALIEVKDAKNNIQIYGSGHHVISDGGARFIKYLDIRNSEVIKSVDSRIVGGIKITWPVVLTLEISDPMTFHDSKRNSPLDVIDDALIQLVSKFSARYQLKDIWGFQTASKTDKKEKESFNAPHMDNDNNLGKSISIYETLAAFIFNNEDLHHLARKYGIDIKHVVIGTFILDKAAEAIMTAAAAEQIQTENNLKKSEYKIKTDEANHRIQQKQKELELKIMTEQAKAEHELDQKKREIQRIQIEEKAKIDLYDTEKKAEVERHKLDRHNENKLQEARNDALLKEEAAKRQLELDRLIENEKAARLLILAQAEADAALIKANAIKKTHELLGKDYVQKKELTEIQANAMVATFSNTQKMVVDPRLGAKHTAAFFDPADAK
jgi:hypothetical protein